MVAPLAISFDLPFDEALDWAKRRVAVLPEEYAKLEGVARARAFSLTGIASLDQIQRVLDSLTAVLEKGGTFASWKSTLDPSVLSLGEARLDNIFRTTIQTSYGIGRWQQHEANKANRPFIIYDAINDGRTRPNHRALNGFIARIDNPVWGKIAPPNGYRCRCTTRSLTEAQARARGWKGHSELPPDGYADKGWDYNPAFGQGEALEKLRLDKLAKADPRIMEKAAAFERERLAALAQKKAEEAMDAEKPPLRDNGGMKPLMPAGLPEKEYLDAFFAAVGGTGKRELFGADMIVDEHLYFDSKGAAKVTKRGRERFVMQLAETILAPDEVFEAEEVYRLKPGELLIKRRFLRIFEIDGNKFGAIVSFYKTKGEGTPFVGSTAFVPINSKGEPDWSYFDKQKTGEMIFQKENPTGRNTAG